ncbi:Sugar kinase of the NBD/HSP70 family, may contain an N-terminal HTH domain [Ensifer adhaerens]|nr:Sugar kinase of the NBD/HSP70 family, may contain an N-terminal HTH domain [Ensifer adhaerens]
MGDNELKFLGSNLEHAASKNRGVILSAIHRSAPISRAELARQSGLTKQAVARIVDRLLDEGLVMEARRRHGLRGQPAIELEINPDGLYSIGANVDRDHLTIVVIDATGALRGRIHHERRFILPGEFIELMQEALSTFRRRRLFDDGRLAGIGLAIPDWLGDVPVIGFPEAYRAWSTFDVRGALEALTHHPILIDNDANAAATGEIDYGLGTEIKSFFYVLVNACLGGATVIDGVRHKGRDGLSGEIGWLPVLFEEGPMAGQVQPLGDMFSMFILMDYLQRQGVDVSTPDDLVHLDVRGRTLVTAWLKRASGRIAEAIDNIGMLVDPEAILVGGRLPVRIIDELLVYVHEHLTQMGLEAPSLHRAACSEDAAALGAAAMPLANRLGLPSADKSQLTRVPLTTAKLQDLAANAAH